MNAKVMPVPDGPYQLYKPGDRVVDALGFTGTVIEPYGVMLTQARPDFPLVRWDPWQKTIQESCVTNRWLKPIMNGVMLMVELL